MPNQSSLAKGESCYRSGQYDDALHFLTEALQEEGVDVARCQYFLGLTWYQKGDDDKAIEHLERCVALAPDRTVVENDPAAPYYYLTLACLRKKDSTAAVFWAEEGLREDARNPRLHNLLGYAHHLIGEHEAALNSYRRAIELDWQGKAYPGTPGVIHSNRARALVALKLFSEALAALDEALRLEPDGAEYYNQRALIFGDRLRDHDEAIKNLRKAIELNPTNGVFYYNLATFLFQQQRYEEAAVFIRKALSVDPEDSQFIELQRRITQNVRVDGELSALMPRVTFADVGGMKELKAEIRRVMNLILVDKEKARRYRVERNGILLYGPPGCGKTFVAEAIAGEFGLKLIRVGVSSIVSRWIGESAQNISKVFEEAIVHAPCLLFFDEFDAIASRRGQIAAHIEDQRTVDAFLQTLDRYRRVSGIVIAAATNNLDALDKAVIREGRFDYKVKIYKPDFEARCEILKAKLRHRPSLPNIDVVAFANGTEGFSTARISALINSAAMAALEADAPIADVHLQQALRSDMGKERFEGRKMSWDDLILDERTKEKLQFIQKFIEHPEVARTLGIRPPSGVLLYGPPGTGKTSIARILASELHASFYLLTPADVLSKWVGDSEQRVRDVFEKARENRPSVIFLDEIDALLSRRNEQGEGQWRSSLVSLFLMEMDGLGTVPGVFVLGATNRPDLLDEALLRPGRLSERIEIPLPSKEQRIRLLNLFTRNMALDDDVHLDVIAQKTDGFSGAELEGLCSNAGRNAMIRVVETRDRPAIHLIDFERALTERRPLGEERDKPIGFITQ